MADLDEAERCVERVRSRVGRIGVHLADDAIVARLAGGTKEVVVEPVRQAALAHRRLDDDAVDIDEARVALAKPQVIGTVVVGALVEGDEEGRDVTGAAGVEGLAQKAPQPCGVEPGQLDGMFVVEREDGGLLAG